MANSARILSTNALYQLVNQPAHGFTRGDVVYFDGATFLGCLASAAASSLAIGMVSAIKDVDNFYVTQVGFVYSIASMAVNPNGAFVPGTLYYLSETTDGKLTATKPLGANLAVPVYIAYTATSGYFLGNYNVAASGGGGGGGLTWSTILANQAALVNSGYIVSAGIPITLTLPAAASLGDVVEVSTLTTNGLVINYGAGQSIILVELVSTITTGNVTLAATGGVLSGWARLTYQGVGNWRMVQSGNWTVT